MTGDGVDNAPGRAERWNERSWSNRANDGNEAGSPSYACGTLTAAIEVFSKDNANVIW